MNNLLILNVKIDEKILYLIHQFNLFCYFYKLLQK